MGIPDFVYAAGPDFGSGIFVSESIPFDVKTFILLEVDAVSRAFGFSGILKDMNCLTLPRVTH